MFTSTPGTDKADVIEGIFVRGQSCLIIDDLITGGGSILQTATTLSEAGLVVRDAVTLIDRQEGGRQALKQAGINLVASSRSNRLPTTSCRPATSRKTSIAAQWATSRRAGRANSVPVTHQGRAWHAARRSHAFTTGAQATANLPPVAGRRGP